MKRIPPLFRVIGSCLLMIVLVACSARGAPTPDFDQTATADRATQNYLCCTAVPKSETITPAPSKSSSAMVLFRGNPQRTGVFDTQAIRHPPQVKWQTKVSDTWLMPPMLADGILYTPS